MQTGRSRAIAGRAAAASDFAENPQHLRSFAREFDQAANLGLLSTGPTAQLAALTNCSEVIRVGDGSRGATPAAMSAWLVNLGVGARLALTP